MNSVAVVPLDIHKKFTQAVLMDKEAGIVGEARIDHYDPEAFERFLAQFEARTDVVMEATFNWPWIADVVTKMGLCPHLAHPVRAREMAKGMAKSDRKDAIFLGRLWLAGDIFPEAYLAPPEVRGMRGLFRQRSLLVRMRTAVKNHIHGQLFRLGVLVDEEVSDLFGKKGRRLLRGLELEDSERGLLDRSLAFLEDLDRHIEVLEGEIRRDLGKDGRAEMVRSIPGVGEILAHAVLSEIGEIERFANGRALAAYAGLLPLSRESADKDYGGRTNRACNRFLRWAALEAVTGAVRSSPRMASLHARVKAKNPKQPGKARVAVAREILELVYLLLTRNQRYQERPARRPGSERSHRSRPNRASQTPLYARSMRSQAEL